LLRNNKREEFKMTTLKDFTLYEDIGSGAYSKVHKIKRKDDGQVYALKKVFLSKLSDKEKENALNEVRILASVSSENVVSYKEAFFETTPSALCIVMEYADGGDLYEKIKQLKKKGARFSEEQIWNIFIQVVKGLKALHAHKVLHRDLKCANVFLNKDGTVKLGDLNVSKVAKAGLVYTQTGTPYYASPEVWQDKPYDSKSDIWSLGVVLYEMCTLNPPFTDTSMQGLCKKVMKGVYSSIPARYSKDLSSLIATLLQVSPGKRPSCSQILHMPALEEHLLDEDDYEICQELLNTIKFPRNIKAMNNKLPKSQYKDDGDLISKVPTTIKPEMPTKSSHPVLPHYKSNDNVPSDVQKEIDKYEAIAEIERKYGGNNTRTGKKNRQIPKTTPSSNNSVPNIYIKYKNEARIIAADSLKKKHSYRELKDKYSSRAKEVEKVEKHEQLLLHKRVVNGVVSNNSIELPSIHRDRNNYHYQEPSPSIKKYNIMNHANSKSEDYRDSARKVEYKPVNVVKHNHRLPTTTKALDNLSIDLKDQRKNRILQHAREIREAVSLNKERATGALTRVSDNSAIYAASIPKWWG
jgi:serine/threonine protein kinase